MLNKQLWVLVLRTMIAVRVQNELPVRQVLLEDERVHPEGQYFLRYRQNGKRMWENVGSDCWVALDKKAGRERVPSRSYPDARLLFLNAKGNPQGHLLRELKRPRISCWAQLQ